MPSSTYSVSRATLAVVCISLLALGCSQSEPGASPERGRISRAIPVVTQIVEYEVLSDELRTVGTARALKSATLLPETAGIVTGVHFSANQTVTEGDLLLTLDDRDERLARRWLRSNVATQRSRYNDMNQSTSSRPTSQRANWIPHAPLSQPLRSQ